MSFILLRFSTLAPVCRFAGAAAAALALAACATRPMVEAAAEEAQESAVQVATDLEARGALSRASLPAHELNEELLYHFLLAEIAAQRGSIGVAAQAYVDLAKRTRDPRVARRATEIASYARLLGPAVESARLWYELEPGSQRAHQTLMGLYLSAGRYDDALPLLQKALGEGMTNAPEAFTQLGRTLANATDKAGALRMLRALAEGHAGVPQARYAVAQAAAAAGEDELALSEVRKAAELRPGWEGTALLEAQILQRKSPAAAIDALTRFLEAHPKSREARLTYARLLVSEKRYADARGQFQRLLADFPANNEVVFAVALLSMQLNDYPLAESNLKQLLAGSYRDKDSVRLYLGQIAEERKNLPEALRWYGEVASGDQYLPAQIRYAGVLAKDGKLDAARSHLKALNARDGAQRVQLILAEAHLLREANQHKVAFDVVSEALSRQPDQPELLYDHAMLAERLDRVDILESSLRRLIQLRPDHAHAYNALGYTLAERNMRLPEARELIERALKLAPTDLFIADSMGWVLYRMGQLKEALQWIERAYAGRPDPEIAAHLGEVLWRLGRHEEAERVLREAAQKNPENETLQGTLKRLKR